MGSANWKNHERTVAKYFKTQRRVRGADFGVSDVEVAVNVEDWLGIPESKAGIVVECKYGKKLGVVRHYKDLASLVHPSDIAIVNLGGYYLCSLEDFEHVYQLLIDNKEEELDLPTMGGMFSLIGSKQEAPEYLIEYHKQAREYLINDTIKSQNCVFLPIVCMAKSGTKGQVVSINITDIQIFREQLYHPVEDRIV